MTVNKLRRYIVPGFYLLTVVCWSCESHAKEQVAISPAERPAILSPLQWETEKLVTGTTAFLDLELTFKEVPKLLEGRTFIRTNFFGTRKVCEQSGIVYVITPSKESKKYSLAEDLERIGFQEVPEVDAFEAFGDPWSGVSCSVYQKHLEEGDRIDLVSPNVVLKSYPSAEKPIVRGKWCVVVADTPRPKGSIGDGANHSGSPFNPPLAQDYTIAAEVPSLDYFVHDPGMILLPNGDFLAFSPCWKRPAGYGKKADPYVIVTRSRDAGKTWEKLPDLPYAEATPFLAQGKLYLFTQPRQHQDVYFTRSDDNGESWEEPVKVLDGPFWNCQTNFVEKDGTLYWVLDKKHQGTIAIAADLSMDLLDPAAWRFSNVLEPVMTPPEFRPNGTELYADENSRDKFRDWNLEGNVMLVGDRLRIATRVNPNPGGTASIASLFDLVDKDGKLELIYDQHVPWPGGQSKFAIVHDPKTNLFWMACNVAAGPVKKGMAPDRRYLMLYFGHDGLNWMPAGCVAFSPTPSQSFMYPSMVIDGDDLAILSRSGRESGHFHDANLSTFHRVRDFRSLAWY